MKYNPYIKLELGTPLRYRDQIWDGGRWMNCDGWKWNGVAGEGFCRPGRYRRPKW